MTIAIWNARYETGISLIDSQHQALFAAINRLADSFKVGDAPQQVMESLDFLARYTDEHFQTEEHYMRELGYPGLASHLDEHAKLMERVRDLQARLAERRPVTMDVTILLADWLKQHIDDVDMGYVDFMKEKNRE
jgi:hemerythrin